MKTNPAALIVCLGLVFGSGCRARYDASEPINVIPQACCKEGDKELQHFKGCRPDGRCKPGEPYWLRGAVTCGPVDDAACAGGRCCEYRTPDDSSDSEAEEESEASTPPAEQTSEPEDATPSESESAEPATDPAPESSEATDDSSNPPTAEPNDPTPEASPDTTTDRA